MPFVWRDGSIAPEWWGETWAGSGNCTTSSTGGYLIYTTTSNSTAASTIHWTPADNWRQAQWAQQEAMIDRRNYERAVQADHHVAARTIEDAAEKLAQENLLAHLTDEQRKTVMDNEWFVVEGGKSKTKYRIRLEQHVVANIDVLAMTGKVLHRLCAHCNIREVPLHDQFLAQKLMIEGDEDAFLAVANRHAA